MIALDAKGNVCECEKDNYGLFQKSAGLPRAIA